MKKLHTVISLILFLTVFATVVLTACRQKDKLSNDSFDISKTGTSAWNVTIGNKERIKVKCFLFPQSSGLEKQFQKRIALEDEAMAWAEKQKEKAIIPELRKSYAEEYQLRKEGRWPWRLVDSWPNYQMVIVSFVLTEKKANKVVIECRPDSNLLDIALTMQSNQDTTFHDCLRVAREIVQQLDKTNVDRSELPLSSVPLYDDEGKLTTEGLPKEFKEFFKDAVFLKQH
jgi:hypothetical protein